MSASTQNESPKDFAHPENKDEQKQLTSLKQSKFTELTSWLQSWGYKVEDKSNQVNVEGIEFQAEITPQVPYFLRIKHSFLFGISGRFKRWIHLENNI